MTEWIFSLRSDICVASMYNRATEEMDWKQTYTALKLFQDMEEGLFDDADTDEWKAFCGRYEQLIDDFRLEEVFMEDDKLFARISGEDGEFTSQLYPIGDNTFGRKGGFAKIEFGKDCLTVDGVTCKKIK